MGVGLLRRILPPLTIVAIAAVALSTMASPPSVQEDGAVPEPAFLQNVDAARVAQPEDLEWDPPRVALDDLEAKIRVHLYAGAAAPATVSIRDATTAAGGAATWQVLPGGETEIPITLTGSGKHGVVLELAGMPVETASVRVIPGWWSILPPLVAIAAAVLLRQVLISLFMGLWLGAMFLYDYNPLVALLRGLDHYVIGTVSDPDNATILIFTMMLGGMVGIIVRNGGTQGIVDQVARWARTPRSGQIATWAMGLIIFFDDYTNTLMVGNTMRPVTDRLRISREKLSFLVDLTAAPVASIALISSWVGVEVGYIDGALKASGLERSAYLTFVESIPYCFYPILALCFSFMIAWTGRDFGPMLKAERRARSTGKVLSDNANPLTDIEAEATAPRSDVPKRWFNAGIPIVVVVFGTFAGLWIDGTRNLAAQGADVLASAPVYEVIAAANPNLAILWGAFSAAIVGVILSLMQRILTVEESMTALMAGMKSMLQALAILVLAWSLKDVCADVSTADFLVEAVSGALAPQLLPVVIFAVAACVSLATGTSYGTMGILLPLVVPVALRVGELGGLSGQQSNVILLGSISSVLAGSVWGDHCSPISDTTILSSMASGADHIDHVRTQIPYALTVAIVGMFLGDIPTAYGVHPLISYAVAIPCLWVIVRYIGRPTEETNAGDDAGERPALA